METKTKHDQEDVPDSSSPRKKQKVAIRLGATPGLFEIITLFHYCMLATLHFSITGMTLKSFKQSTSHHHHYHQQHKHHPDVIIKDYIVGCFDVLYSDCPIFRLSHDKSTTFGSTIENFIQCTIDSQETNPHIVRQFMTGIKNYLVKHGEGQLEDTIEKERKRLSSNEILNIDATIERALHVCVLQPLKHHIYTLFVNEYTRNGSLKALSNNIKYARTKSAEDIGLRKHFICKLIILLNSY
ncbi:hypothetical protein KUTeg_013525 [Tegillarca granosa]|uniref:Uncharacterized protein n=1 Tax=Tegillarca granosa TaxID=220873 RepID=A0ABQ9EXG1_TEGGR|nr:hypothetical protein KUTeg_013525 [Tegillarca granosa]